MNPRAIDVPSVPRVLLITESANPEWVSVPLEGWSHSRAIAALVSAHVVTQVRNRDAFLRAGLEEGRDFTSIDSERVARSVHRLASWLRGGAGKGWTTVQALSTLSYYYFEHLVWQRFGRRIRAGEFDIVHRLTPLSPTTPSLLAGRCRRAGVPFVLGPLNGGVPWPRQFDGARRAEKEWLSYVRSAYKLLPGHRSTLRNAAAILAGSKDTLKQIPRDYHSKSFYVPENAVDPARFTQERTGPARVPIRAVFVGRLVPYKGADMVVEAMAPLLRQNLVQLTIIGDGPQLGQLRGLIQGGNLTGVDVAGWVDHKELQKRLVTHDLFLFPSIREFGGGVVLEAMAVGLVPVVVNYGGPGELVTPESGYLIDMSSRAEIIQRLRAIVAQVVDRPDSLAEKRVAAMSRAREQFTWQAKAQQVVGIYDHVLRSSRASRPPRPATPYASERHPASHHAPVMVPSERRLDVRVPVR